MEVSPWGVLFEEFRGCGTVCRPREEREAVVAGPGSFVKGAVEAEVCEPWCEGFQEERVLDFGIC